MDEPDRRLLPLTTPPLFQQMARQMVERIDLRAALLIRLRQSHTGHIIRAANDDLIGFFR